MAATQEEMERLCRQAKQSKEWEVVDSLPKDFKLRFRGSRKVEAIFSQETGKFATKFFGSGKGTSITMMLIAPGIQSLSSQVQNTIDRLSNKGFYMSKGK